MTRDEAVEALRACDLFAQLIFRTFSQRLIGELSDDRVSLPQVHTVRYLWLHERVLMGDLATGLGIRYPSATNMVKRLEQQGLVERSVNPDDRREVEVRLTDEGYELAERMETCRTDRLQAVLEQMDPSDREAFLSGVRAFVQVAATTQPGISAEICLRCGVNASGRCPVASLNEEHL